MKKYYAIIIAVAIIAIIANVTTANAGTKKIFHLQPVKSSTITTTGAVNWPEVDVAVYADEYGNIVVNIYGYDIENLMKATVTLGDLTIQTSVTKEKVLNESASGIYSQNDNTGNFDQYFTVPEPGTYPAKVLIQMGLFNFVEMRQDISITDEDIAQ